MAGAAPYRRAQGPPARLEPKPGSGPYGRPLASVPQLRDRRGRGHALHLGAAAGSIARLVPPSARPFIWPAVIALCPARRIASSVRLSACRSYREPTRNTGLSNPYRALGTARYRGTPRAGARWKQGIGETPFERAAKAAAGTTRPATSIDRARRSRRLVSGERATVPPD